MTTPTRSVCGADVGRAAVLAVEEAAFGGTDADARRPWPDLVARSEALTCGSWWASTNAPAVDLRRAKTGARASSATDRVAGGAIEVRISDEQRTVATLAHELAHAVAGVATGHGERFRAAHVDVVAAVAGEQVAEHLRAAYEAFDLAVGVRDWPAPTVATGAGFVWRAHG